MKTTHKQENEKWEEIEISEMKDGDSVYIKFRGENGLYTNLHVVKINNKLELKAGPFGTVIKSTSQYQAIIE